METLESKNSKSETVISQVPHALLGLLPYDEPKKPKKERKQKSLQPMRTEEEELRIRDSFKVRNRLLITTCLFEVFEVGDIQDTGPIIDSSMVPTLEIKKAIHSDDCAFRGWGIADVVSLVSILSMRQVVEKKIW